MPLAALIDRVKIDIAYCGSCTAGKREDFDHYHAVLSWAAQRGLKVPSNVALYLQFGTVAVRDIAERGYLTAFEQVGAELLQPAGGVCELRSRRINRCGPSHDQRNQSQLSRSLRSRTGVARQPANGCGERDRRRTGFVRGTASAMPM